MKKTIPWYMCQRFPRLPSGSVVCWKDSIGFRSCYTQPYSKRTQIRTGKEKGAWDKVQEEPCTSFLVSSRGTELSLILPSMIHGSMCKVLPTREAHRVLAPRMAC